MNDSASVVEVLQQICVAVLANLDAIEKRLEQIEKNTGKKDK